MKYAALTLAMLTTATISVLPAQGSAIDFDQLRRENLEKSAIA